MSNLDLIGSPNKLTLGGENQKNLGQVFTPNNVAQFMASMFNIIQGNIRLLDPGCGPCALTAAFVNEIIIRDLSVDSIHIDAIEVDPTLEGIALDHLQEIQSVLEKLNMEIEWDFILQDVIELFSSQAEFGYDFSLNTKLYTHVIMNPPYKKIAANSNHRRHLKCMDLDTINLYSAFVMIAINKLTDSGELVAIIPRSFCNGVYYKSFRQYLLKECSIEKIHLFESRNSLFSDSNVLQENIILHLVKGKKQGPVEVSTGNTAREEFVLRVVPFDEIVLPDDTENFIRITTSDFDKRNVQIFNEICQSSLDDLGLQVSTGPVVDFRMKEDLSENIGENMAPLLYPIHLGQTVCWPKKSRKPNAIIISNKSKSSLWKNEGYFVLVKRFSSKEQCRRINATLYEGHLPGSLIGFDNKLNVFHIGKTGFGKYLALGLYIYLNSSRLDLFYRMFGGHTQINVTDLKNIKYPSFDCLQNLGEKAKNALLSQDEIDYLFDEEINKMFNLQYSEDEIHTRMALSH